MADSEKNINTLRTHLSNIFNSFNVWKSLQNSSYNKTYNRNKHFWGIIVFSLQKDFLMSLARLFEKREKNDVFSVYYLLDFLSLKQRGKVLVEVKGFDKEIRNLVIWRQKILAHNDIFFTLNPGEVFKRFPIKNTKIEEMIDLLAKILGFVDSVRTKRGQVYSFKLIKEESKRDVDNIISMIELGVETQKIQRTVIKN